MLFVFIHLLRAHISPTTPSHRFLVSLVITIAQLFECRALCLLPPTVAHQYLLSFLSHCQHGTSGCLGAWMRGTAFAPSLLTDHCRLCIFTHDRVAPAGENHTPWFSRELEQALTRPVWYLLNVHTTFILVLSSTHSSSQCRHPEHVMSSAD